MVTITVKERGHNLLEMRAWLLEQDIEYDSDWSWGRDMQSWRSANDREILLNFYFRNGCESTATLFALKFVK